MKLTLVIVLISINVFAQGPYAPVADSIGTTAIHKDSSAFIDWASACIIERGWKNITDTTLGKTSTGDMYSATEKSGVNGVVSLGDGGSAILTFSSPIINGNGPDFAVFENAFNNTFLELAHVEVSSDGINYFRFESSSLSQINSQIMNEVNTTDIQNLAGKYRAQFGTPFDLEEMIGITNLDVNNITHVKIIDAIGSINQSYASYDSQGNMINDPFPTPFETGGFDLDAIGVIHSFVGIEESLNTFKVFPNPAKEKATIIFDNLSDKTIQLIDLNGVIVFQLKSNSNQIDLDLFRYSKGVYILKLIEGGNINIQKLLIN
ncbi:MAG: T9SS type A sorting domain-containing protein [Flavobacteriales bacterium]|nr:T9SS type A sorting domain-containing protein [Flavobacteriales bacterium]